MLKSRRKFKFLKQLSEGTFGRVYMAELQGDNNFSKVVAIKLLHGKWLDHEEIVKRSRDEARVLGLINHPGIIKVDGLTSIDGKCAIIMEYLDGVDLKNLVTYCSRNKVHIPARVCLEVIEETVSALEAAFYHEPLRGGEPLRLIHRDIKPSNIMLTVKKEIKVLDFGTAQASFSDREARTQALAFGSAPYMAPERIMGEEDHPSGDVFSVGITLFEMLTQHRFGKIMYRVEPYEEDLRNRMDFLNNHLKEHKLHENSDKDNLIRKDIIQLLFDVLSYDAPERPDLRELKVRCGELSDQIHDGSLRQFCNDIVTTCRDAFLSESSVVDDPYVMKDDFIIEDRSDVYTQETHGIIPPAEVTMPLSDETVKSDAHVYPSPQEPVALANEKYDVSVKTQLLSSEPTPQQISSEGAGKSVTLSSAPIFNTENSQITLDESELGDELHGVASSNELQGVKEASRSTKKVVLLALFSLTFLALIAAVAVRALLNGVVESEEVAEIEEEKSFGMQIDMQETQDAGSVTLSLDQAGAAVVKIPINGETHEWDGFGAFVIQNTKAGKITTRFSETEISSKSMRLEVKAGQNCTYVLITTRDKSSWEEIACQSM